VAAIAQAAPEIAMARGVPTTCAMLPMNNVPKDQSPLSMKYKLSIRPSKSGGVSIWTTVFATERIAMLLAPTRIKDKIDRGNEREKENKISEAENAKTLIATKCMRRRNLPNEAMPRPAMTAPMPEAASNKPNVEKARAKEQQAVVAVLERAQRSPQMH
jgi:hypothetical protein